MPRTKEFDRDAVLLEAVAVFRDSGYEGTSIQVLVDRLGIHRASLYDTYGSKAELYREALSRYEALVQERYGPLLDAPGRARSTLERFFERLAEDLTRGAPGPTGCLMLKSALSGARHLVDVPAEVRGHYDWFGRHFERLIARARLEGDLRGQSADSEVAADLRRVLVGALAVAAVDGDALALRGYLQRQLALFMGDREP